MDKSISWYIEKLAGPILGIVVCFLFFKYLRLTILFNDVNVFISKISDISFIIFGFLLAFIGLILNSKEKIIQAFDSKKVFNKTIDLNFRIIVLSAICGIYGLVVWIIFQSTIIINVTIEELLIDILVFFLIWLVYDLIYFIRVFFTLIKNYS